MLITRECDYAVRVIRALNQENRLSVGEICEKENITAPFAYKILKKLQKAKIVRGFRGVHGGYTLRIPVSELNLLIVYQAIDPDVFIIDCMAPEYRCTRNEGNEICKVHAELERIQKSLIQGLTEKSLKQVFEQ
ncbi:MAG: Rrf2 family transcriptional regulator [Eubacteriales bacterium]|nr:Rrf2 family transcriptional regulator [Eubacteriales bacterium]